MSGGSGTQTTTQKTELPPEFRGALQSIIRQSQGLNTQYRDQPLTPDLSNLTMQGIDTLAQGPDAGAVDQLRRTAMGEGPTNPFTSAISLNGTNQFASAQNPFATGQNSYADVEDAIMSSANRAVSDRFSQAGRGGSPAESSVLAREVSSALAPYAYGARENELQRGFAGEENRLGRQFAGGESDLARQFAAQMQGQSLGANSFEAQQARQMQALGPLLGLNQVQAEGLLQGGGIIDQFNQQRQYDPFTLLNLTTDPIVRAMGGAGSTTSTQEPITRNRTAGAVGGAAAGAKIGSTWGPWGTGIGAAAGGLLGYL